MRVEAAGGTRSRKCGAIEGRSQELVRNAGYSGLLTPSLEELSEQRTAISFKHPTSYTQVMVEAPVVGKVHHRPCGPTLRIEASVHEAAHPGMKRRSHAHGAWLHRRVQSRSRKSVIQNRGAGSSERKHFRVGRGIIQVNAPVASTGEQAVVTYHHCTHGDLAAISCCFRLLDRQHHPTKVDFAGF